MHYYLHILQGYNKVFRHLKRAICGWLVYLKKNALNIKFLLASYPHLLTISFELTKSKLKSQSWSKAILGIYTGLDHFIIGNLQKWILEAAIDRLEIQSWLKGETVPNWISSLSMAAFKIHFNVKDKMV